VTLVRISRRSARPVRPHVIEEELDSIEVHRHIRNDGTLTELHDQLDWLVATLRLDQR
jgi:hypothetical protein